MTRVKRIFLKRIVLVRVLFYGSIILFLYTTIRYMNNTSFAKNITPIYFLKNKGDTNFFYNLAGVVKPGSINFIRGTDEVKFTLTDFDHDIYVYYKGALPNNFLEGNTVIATGNITDADKPNIFVSNKLMTDHSYNADKWLSNYSIKFRS